MTPEKLFHELLGLGMNWEVMGSRITELATLSVRCIAYYSAGLFNQECSRRARTSPPLHPLMLGRVISFEARLRL